MGGIFGGGLNGVWTSATVRPCGVCGALVKAATAVGSVSASDVTGNLFEAFSGDSLPAGILAAPPPNAREGVTVANVKPNPAGISFDSLPVVSGIFACIASFLKSCSNWASLPTSGPFVSSLNVDVAFCLHDACD